MSSTPPFALLFDLDGTLLDSIDLLLECMEFAFAGRATVPTRAAWTAGIGIPLREQMCGFDVAEQDIELLVRLGVPPARALFVGDSTHDMRAGRAAGTFTRAALWGPFSRAQLETTQPTHWLESLDEVPELVDSLRGSSVSTSVRGGVQPGT